MNLAKFIDHTLLKPQATLEEIQRLCEEARRYGFFSVCVNGARVEEAKRFLEGSEAKVAAVAGFPLGAMTAKAKALEAEDLVRRGADEIDMTLNVGLLLDGAKAGVLEDIKGVVAAAEGRPVKVILETCLLDKEQKVLACELSAEAGAAFVKTSTGFSSGGATVEDVRLMKATVGDRCEVKASGGVRDTVGALAMLEAGATRLGTSSGIAIVTGQGFGGAY